MISNSLEVPWLSGFVDFGSPYVGKCLEEGTIVKIEVFPIINPKCEWFIIEFTMYVYIYICIHIYIYIIIYILYTYS